jgi:cytochrome c oxidase assembly protein Cox11
MKNKMKKIYLIIVALSFIGTTNAQIYQTFLKVTHSTSGSSVTDEIAFEGGEIILLDNTININFVENIADNRSYAFDKVTTFAFETRNLTAINKVDVSQKLGVSVDKAGEMLRISSNVSLGKISIWSISGALLVKSEIDSNEIDINIASLPQGVYIVQSGASKVKFVK